MSISFDGSDCGGVDVKLADFDCLLEARATVVLDIQHIH